MDIGSQESMQAAAGVGYQRPQSSTSLSPPASGLVVPQPINPRLSGQMGMGQIGVGLRKYQCKMCPQVWKLIYKKMTFIKAKLKKLDY